MDSTSRKSTERMLRILQKWLDSLWPLLFLFIVSRTGACSGITPNENERARFLIFCNHFSETLLRVAFYRVYEFPAFVLCFPREYIFLRHSFSKAQPDSLQAVFPSSAPILSSLQKIYLCTILQPFRRNSLSSILQRTQPIPNFIFLIFSMPMKGIFTKAPGTMALSYGSKKIMPYP